MSHTSRRPSQLLVYSITLTGITANTLVSPALPDILAGVGASPSAAGLLISAATLPGILLAPVIGILADRVGRRRVLVPCMILFGLAGGAGAFAPNLTALVILRLLQGAGSAGLINLAVVIIGDHWSGTERARMIGRNAGVLTAALALFPVVGGVLVDLGSWRTPFLLYPLALVSAWAVTRSLPSAVEPREDRLGEQLSGAARLIRRPQVLAIMATTFLTFSLIFALVLTTLPVHAEQVFGLGPGWRGLLLGIPAIATFTVSLNLGRLTTRVGRTRLLVAGAGAFAVGYLTMGLAGLVPLLVVGLIMAGLGEGLIVPPLQDAVTAIGPAEHRGTVVAMFVSAARGGQTLGPLLASAGMASVGTGPVFVVGAVIAFGLSLAIAAGRRLIPAA